MEARACWNSLIQFGGDDRYFRRAATHPVL